MSEINNNIGKIQQPQIKTEKTEKIEAKIENAVEEQKIVKDFSNPKAEVLGRSQVKTSNADNLKTDIAFLSANPEAVVSAEKFFKVAYSQLLQKDVPNAYEKAASMATTYAKEMADKK